MTVNVHLSCVVLPCTTLRITKWCASENMVRTIIRDRICARILRFHRFQLGKYIQDRNILDEICVFFVTSINSQRTHVATLYKIYSNWSGVFCLFFFFIHTCTYGIQSVRRGSRRKTNRALNVNRFLFVALLRDARSRENERPGATLKTHVRNISRKLYTYTQYLQTNATSHRDIEIIIKIESHAMFDERLTQ